MNTPVVLSVSRGPLSMTTLRVALELATVRMEQPTHIVLAAPITRAATSLLESVPIGPMGAGISLIAAIPQKMGTAFAVVHAPPGTKLHRITAVAIAAVAFMLPPTK